MLGADITQLAATCGHRQEHCADLTGTWHWHGTSRTLSQTALYIASSHEYAEVVQSSIDCSEDLNARVQRRLDD